MYTYNYQPIYSRLVNNLAAQVIILVRHGIEQETKLTNLNFRLLDQLGQLISARTHFEYFNKEVNMDEM